MEHLAADPGIQSELLGLHTALLDALQEAVRPAVGRGPTHGTYEGSIRTREISELAMMLETPCRPRPPLAPSRTLATMTASRRTEGDVTCRSPLRPSRCRAVRPACVWSPLVWSARRTLPRCSR